MWWIRWLLFAFACGFVVFDLVGVVSLIWCLWLRVLF